MGGVKSRSACIRCRARHLKCDELRPGCQRCSRSKKACPGYVKETRFLDEGIGLRKRFNYKEYSPFSSGSKRTFTHAFEEPQIQRCVHASQNQMTKAAEGSMLDQITLVHRKSNFPHDIRAQDVEHVIDDMYQFHPLPGTGFTSNGLNAENGKDDGSRGLASETAVSPEQGFTTIPSLGQSPYSVQGSTILEFDSILPLSIPTDPELLCNTGQSIARMLSSVFNSSVKPSALLQSPVRNIVEEEEDEHEILFLMRHFAEIPGQWMDLYDLGGYFARCLPVKAVTSPLLRNSACAIAAKQLGRVKGQKAILGGVCSKQASSELYPNCDQVNWLYVAARYYDKAISALREAIMQRTYATQSIMDTPSVLQDEGRRKRRRDQDQHHINCTDELLAATSILSVYEFMDDSNVEWSRHLDGVRSILDEAKANLMPDSSKPSRAQVATFWNFARCDYLAAYINHTKTRLDTGHLALWRSAGLHIEDEHMLESTSMSSSTHLPVQEDGREDMVSNGLVWILSKLMNHLAEPEQGLWVTLEHELKKWHDSLPETFTPVGRLDPDKSSDDPSRRHFAEIFYSIPLCAVTMQHYHFAQMILLFHMPQEAANSVRDQLRCYREIPDKILYHSREIVAIALGRPPGYVRIHMLQPLFVAGQCLEGNEERKIVLELLRGIETDLGWATEYRVKELLAEWGWQEDVNP